MKEVCIDLKHMKFFCRCKIDELIQEHGHEVLCLPPYHCHFIPIELVWSQVKMYYNSNIGRSGSRMEAVTNMWGGIIAVGLFPLFIGCRLKTWVLHRLPCVTTT
jgi:transposase